MVAGIQARLIDIWRRLRITKPRYRHVDYYASQSEVPGSIRRHTIAIVGTVSAPKWALFECPCGTNHRVVLNLAPSQWPCWTIEKRDAGINMAPSVDVREGRRCHYWVRGGRVTWC
jgi:hypothetical protein